MIAGHFWKTLLELISAKYGRHCSYLISWINFNQILFELNSANIEIENGIIYLCMQFNFEFHWYIYGTKHSFYVFFWTLLGYMQRISFNRHIKVHLKYKN
jgi:ABC-type transport system involved in Fe-S cluster assembly fused permease/ATPase subunit